MEKITKCSYNTENILIQEDDLEDIVTPKNDRNYPLIEINGQYVPQISTENT
jgi:hypothetical protein